MTPQKVRIEPKVDLASKRITIDEYTSEPDLFGDVRQGAVDRHVRWVIDTREMAIRDALIRLGWRPPGDFINPSGLCSQSDTVRLVRSQDPGTSVAAAERVAAFAEKHFACILDALDGRELTAKEMAAIADLTVEQIARRMPDLRRAGQVEVVQKCDATGANCDLVRDRCRVWRRLY